MQSYLWQSWYYIGMENTTVQVRYVDVPKEKWSTFNWTKVKNRKHYILGSALLFINLSIFQCIWNYKLAYSVQRVSIDRLSWLASLLDMSSPDSLLPKSISSARHYIVSRSIIARQGICSLWSGDGDPANTRRSSKVCTMLDQRRRRWANIVQTLGNRIVFAGKGHFIETAKKNCGSMLGHSRKWWANFVPLFMCIALCWHWRVVGNPCVDSGFGQGFSN